MHKKIIVMGVSGCGKSTIGELLAQSLDIEFFDGDDFHPKANVDKMAKGIPLTDDDRQSWLLTLNELIQQKDSLVIACSALKPTYREMLRHNAPDLKFVYLHADFKTIWDRMSRREGHYFKGPEMLQSQFDALVEPSRNEAIYMDIANSPTQIVRDVCTQLGA